MIPEVEVDTPGDWVQTSKGLLPKAGLERREGVDENDNERCKWVEYWLDGERIHRSAHMHLKTGIFAEAIQADFG